MQIRVANEAEASLNSFDANIIFFLNQFARRSSSLDYLIMLIGSNTLTKGCVITSLIWWAWFRSGVNKIRDREYLLCGILACVISVFVARALADTLPYRERPCLSAALHFQLPYHVDVSSQVIHWSSFPSDHAALFFALATSIFFVSRGAGILALCHALVVVSLPRVYMGFHYPTDILAGAVIGVGSASLAKISAVRASVTRPAMYWLERFPGAFYAFLFILTFLITVVFDPVRKIFVFAFGIMESVLHRLH
ncbi:MAG TPA: phosphatase PAP2 family protein [Candidatus Acidoferrales bacterium]|nr:phosphatase PAP2 family protein [Candidatus Acidoferrales bacterium]